MSLIAPERKVERQTMAVKIDRRLLAVVKAYATFIASSQEYFVREALLATIVSDPEFRGWVLEAQPETAQALARLLAERPGTKSAVRSSKVRPLATGRASHASGGSR